MRLTYRHDPSGNRLPSLAAIVALYLVLALPYVLWPLDPQPDERRYSIAAVEMIASGDYLVPLSETGELRLKKPPLTYYYVAAGFALLGETLAGAKLFFLVSATVIVILVYSLGRALGASVLAATLGAAMMVGNRLFFTTSTQYIPDMPLVLGITAALIGFVHVLRGTARPWHIYLAWTGIAWAVLAKGFLALLMLPIYAVVRWLPGTPAIGPSLRRHEVIAAILAFLLGGSWFALLAYWHFDELIAQFFGDQVTGKVKFDWRAVLAGISKTSRSLFILSLPGLLALAIARIAAGRDVNKRRLREAAIVFLSLWIVLNIVIFAFSRQVYGRYALPAAPALMALSAAYASLLPVDALANGLRRAMRILLPLLAVIVLLGSLIGLLFGAVGWGIAGVMVAIVGLPLLWRALAARPLLAGIAAVALFFPGVELAKLPIAHAVLFPTEGQVAAARIAQLDPADRVLIVHKHAQLIDRIGVELRDFARLDYAVTLPEPPDVAMIIFYNSDLREPLQRAGYRIDSTPVANEILIEPKEIWALIALRDATALRKAIGIPLFFATQP